MWLCLDPWIPLLCGKPKLGPRSSSRRTDASTDSCSSSDKPAHHSPKSSVFSTSHYMSASIASTEYSVNKMMLRQLLPYQLLRNEKRSFRTDEHPQGICFRIWRRTRTKDQFSPPPTRTPHRDQSWCSAKVTGSPSLKSTWKAVLMLLNGSLPGWRQQRGNPDPQKDKSRINALNRVCSAKIMWG